MRVITRLNIGGPGRQALLLTKALRTGWDTTLLAGRPAPDEGELFDPEVTVTRIPLTRPVRPMQDARSFAAVRRVLRSQDTQLLHTHMAKAGTVGRLAAVSLRRRPAVVHTFHGHVLDGYFRPGVQRAFIEMERHLAKRTDALIAVSPEVRDDLLALGIGRHEQFRVIRNGFDLDAHHAVSGRSGLLRERLGVGDDVALVGAVGRLVPVKNLALLLRAAARLPDVCVAIVGDGEQRSELEALAASLGIADRTHFTGWLLDVPSVMADLDVVALTSHSEGTPTSLIEASACGRPVVATDVGGVASVVTHGRGGLLVPAGDVGAVADALDELLRDPERRRRMGLAGRLDSKVFRWERLVAELSALYDELVPPT